MNEPTRAVRLPGAGLRRFGHVCAFFHSREEEYRVLLPLAKEGFERGDKVFHIVDAEHLPERVSRLNEVGISPVAARRPGQVEIRAWEDAYLQGRHFDKEAMMTLLEETLRGAKADGFGQTRVWASMEWALGEFPGVEDLVEYETRLNYFLPRCEDLVVCTYDLTKFGAGVVLDILRTHPMVIIGGILQENPFFVPPDEFLGELRERDAPTPLR